MLLKNDWDTNNQQEWVLFNSKKNTLITERTGKDVILYSTDDILKTLPKNSILNSYLVGNASTLKDTKKVQNLMFFKGNKILILDRLGIYPKNWNPDILILTQNPKVNLERLLQSMSPKIVLADASNYKTIQKLWESSCSKQKIPFHATGEKGFYKLN